MGQNMKSENKTNGSTKEWTSSSIGASQFWSQGWLIGNPTLVDIEPDIQPWLTSDQGTRSSDGKGTLAIAVDQACQDLGWPGFFNIFNWPSFSRPGFRGFQNFQDLGFRGGSSFHCCCWPTKEGAGVRKEDWFLINLKFDKYCMILQYATDVVISGGYELRMRINYLALDSFIMCASLDLLASLHLWRKIWSKRQKMRHWETLKRMFNISSPTKNIFFTCSTWCLALFP